MNARTSSLFVQAVLAIAFGTVAAVGQTATNPAATGTAAIIIPTQGPIQWKLTVETFEKTLKMACAQKPQALILQINSPGGVVDYTWNMISQFKSMPQRQTVAWISGEHNGAFSSGAIFALACDKIYLAQGQAIGAAVPFSLDDNGIPRDVSLKWRSAWHAQVRSLCEMKHRPWPVVYALLNTGAGLYKIKTSAGHEYVNYDKIRPMLKPELVTQMDVVFKTHTEESADEFSGTAHATITKAVSFKDGMPPNVEVICEVGDVLTLTTQEAVACGLCDGTAESVEELLQKVNMPADPHPTMLADPFKQSNKQMEGIVKMFLASMAAVGGSVQATTDSGIAHRSHLRFTEPALGNARTLAEYRKIKSLIDRYPDLVTSQQTRAEIEAAITHIQASLQQQQESQRAAHEQELKTNRPPIRMDNRPR